MVTSAGAAAPSRFQILTELGSGGFGAVYEAVDSRGGQRVALKVLDDISASSIARFKQEFRALRDCHHPNLVSLKELIEEHGRWNIVMELVPGSDFLGYVREHAGQSGAEYDESRLRRALLGVARGLVALHGFGVLHRDLKPSNVRVTPDGRAVLLDFGLVTSVDPSRQSTHVAVLGTAPYMAPEQATRSNVGPPADWYAFGVCLFEALTGRWPFDGETLFDILNRKNTHEAPRASSLRPEVPSDLDELCAGLLERDPSLRAGARDVLQTLGAGGSLDDEATLLSRSAPLRVPFAGREPELRQLERALSRVEQGSLRMVLVEGESGVGKSELVAEFVQRTRLREPELLTLQGRCYENEQVAYKALDGCIDEMARFLQRLPGRACALLLPARAALLAQLFPMLRSVRAIAMAPDNEPSADPTARRLEAFSALARLLKKLADERPVVMMIDDLQWADAESFRLLLALMEDQEPPPVLIVATIRPAEELDREVSAGIESLRRKQRMDVIPILGLPEQEAAALARKLLGPSAPEPYCRMIAAESGGHPLFLSELVQFARSHDMASRGALTLEAAIRARMDRLEAPARALLEIAALAARPYASHIFAAALGVPDVEDAARTLLATKLLRLRRRQELGCYHDRIRHTAVDMIARSRLPELHRRLAKALSEDAESDAFEQAQHWDLAGDHERAVDAYARAAEAAYQALAFIRAADLCMRAMRLSADAPRDKTHRLLVLQADALACAGRSTEAAGHYERAAARAGGAQRIQLRARHAQQLLLSGKLEQGDATMRALLRELGIRLPRGLVATLLQIAALRFWLALRGHKFKVRPAREGEEHLVLTADVLGTFSHAISPIHPLTMMLLTLRAALFAFKIPLPANVLQLYLALGWVRALGGAPRAAERMFARGHQLASSVQSDVAVANALLIEGSARLATAELGKAVSRLEEAHHLLQTRCPDQPGQLRNVRYHLGLVWYARGEHARVARETERWTVEARERNDPLTIALITGMGYGFVRHLMRDDPESALHEIEGAMRELPAEPFSFVHLGALTARATSLLYKRGAAAHEWLEAHLDALGTPFLMRTRAARLPISIMRAQAALHASANAAPELRATLLAHAAREGRWLSRMSVSLARAHGQLLLAQVHMLQGDKEQALAAARAACAASSPHADGTTGTLAGYFTALIETGNHDDRRCRSVVDSYREQGWQRPLAFLTTVVPALAQLVPPDVEASPASADTALLGSYEVVRTIGGGGFGTVVQATDKRTGRSVALKELVSKNPRSLERFKQEFRELRNVHHANLVRLEAMIEHAGRWYIAMELLQGQDLVAYCRPGGILDPQRVRGAFVGLCEGLGALHAAGFAHRDVTPDNVRVTEDGRAVLLDFGLIGRLGDEHDRSSVGSIEHAAPEQLEGCVPSTSADVYALGSCLYQALCGDPPFRADLPASVLHKKSTEAPPPLSSAGYEELAQLALDMLGRSPAVRPALPTVRTHLLGVPLASMAPPRGVTAEFSGREEELDCLYAAFERSCDEGLQIVLVEGESGLGKSALMAEFGRLTQARAPNVILLRNRCYESARVAFKAFDEAVDQLARALRELPNPACEALLPKRAALLSLLFPVLASVPSIAQASPRGIPADPGARQRAAIDCFVELLTRLSGKFELLFLIDDLQWADPESFRLLASLAEQRLSLPLLVVCTVRPAAEVAPDVASELAALRVQAGTQVICLNGLSEAAASRMVTSLTGGAQSAESVERLLLEAKGHPLFLRELVEQERSGATATGALTLDSALRRRVESLDHGARSLLSLVALAGRPYGMHVFAGALGAGIPRAALVSLLDRGLLRYSGSDGLAIYHDRIARVTLALLTPSETQRLAGDLAATLEREAMGDASDRARLWDVAGEAARATASYAEAGERALQALQFGAAARHYGRALELLAEGESERRRELLVQQGQALARAGQSADAARAYQAAAVGTEGPLATRLRTLAAEQAIQGAEATWGLQTARTLLAELGIPVPTSAIAAAATMVRNRLAVRLRRLTSSAPASTSPQARMQLDAAWSLTLPISWLDPMAGAALTTHHLRLAGASGEPTHIARALAAEAFTHALEGRASRQKVDALLQRARVLAQKHGDPALEAEVDYREGLVTTYSWDLQLALECLERALHTVNERCPDQPWLTTNIRLALGAVWFNLAEHARLAQASRTWMADARGRGDKFALTTLFSLGNGFVTELMADAPENILAHLELHRPLWPTQPYSFVHFGDLLATCYALTYGGGPAGYEWFERELPRLRHAGLLRYGTGRAVYLYVGATAALTAWAAGPERAAKPLARAREYTQELSKLQSTFAAHIAPYLRAQLDAVEGRRERALLTVRRARERAQQSGFVKHVQRTTCLESVLVGGPQGEQMFAELARHYAEGGWKRPDRMLAALCPVASRLR